jgi:hypothetical protein
VVVGGGTVACAPLNLHLHLRDCLIQPHTLEREVCFSGSGAVTATTSTPLDSDCRCGVTLVARLN